VVLSGAGERAHAARVESGSADVSLRDLSLEGYVEPATWFERGSHRLERVRVRGSGGGVLTARSGTEVDLEDVDIADLVPWSAGYARGIEADGGTVRCTRCTVTRAVGYGVYLSGGDLAVDGLLVEETIADVDGGAGLMMDAGGGLAGSGVVVRGASEAGVQVQGAGSTVDLVDLAVSDVVDHEGVAGFGLAVYDATVTLGALDVRNVTGAGVLFAGAAVSAGTVRIEGVSPGDSRRGELGYGLYVGSLASVALAGVEVSDCHGAGVVVSDAGTLLELSGASVSGVRAAAATRLGLGLMAQYEGELHAEDVVVEGVATAAVGTAGGGRAEVRGATFGELRPEPEDVVYGLVAVNGEVVLEDVDGEGWIRAAVQVTGGSLDATSLRLLGGTLNTYGDGAGIQVDGGGRAELADVEIEGAPVRALIAYGAGSELTLSGGRVADSVDASGIGYATLVEAVDGGRVEASALALGGGLRGAVLADAGTVRLVDSTLAGTRGADGVGTGFQASGAGWLDLEGVEVSDVDAVGILVTGAGSTLTATHLVVADVRPVTSTPVAIGLVVQDGAEATLTDAQLRGVGGPGLLASTGARVHAEGLVVDEVEFAGVVADGASLTLGGVAIGGVAASPSFGGGLGLYLASTSGETAVALDGGEVAASPLAAVWIDGPGSYLLDGLALAGGEGAELGGGRVHGNAIYAHDADVTVIDSTLATSRVAVLLDDAGATLAGNRWEGNTVDLVVQACGDHGVPEVDGATDPQLCPTYDLPVLPLSFDVALTEVVASDG